MVEVSEPVVVGGLVPFTTIDFPGRLAAVVFLQGCPWRCTYCHNPRLLPRRGADNPPWSRIAAWLESRRGLLGGVVFSGGEPLLQRGLPAAVEQVRAMGFACALHTAGPYPERLAALLPALDWVGFDVKAPFGEYRPVTGADDGRAARDSLALLAASGVPYEVRCTVAPGLLDALAIARLAEQLSELGVTRLVLQGCRDGDHGLRLPDPRLADAARRHLPSVELRG